MTSYLRPIIERKEKQIIIFSVKICKNKSPLTYNQFMEEKKTKIQHSQTKKVTTSQNDSFWRTTNFSGISLLCYHDQGLSGQVQMAEERPRVILY